MRESWDSYFLSIARQVATRSTCDRKHVGAVLVRDRTILSTGFNGSVRGMPHCDDVGHVLTQLPEGLSRIEEWLNREIEDDPTVLEPGTEIHDVRLALRDVRSELQHCEATVHAEANAIVQAARNGVRIEGAVVYTTAFPCWSCTKLLLNAGVSHCFYGEAYRVDPMVTQAWGERISVVQSS